MSNPAVIILDEVNTKNSKFKRFVIEDNIGESIHLHIDNMRIDFTINEFLEFSEIIRESFEAMDVLGTYSLKNFDVHFIKECAPFLPDLKEIKIEEIELSKLKCIVHSNYKNDLNLIDISSVANIPAYQYLTGNKQAFINYKQYNYSSTDNESRLKQTHNSIKENGYPFQEKYIVLFEGQDIVRDGQHRAAILAYLNGLDAKIKVMRFYFEGDKHKISAIETNTKTATKWFVRKVYRKLKRIIKG